MSKINIIDVKNSMENEYISKDYLTKKDIYELANYFTRKLGTKEVNPFNFCEEYSQYLDLELKNFDSKKLGGLIYKNSCNKKSWVILNTSLSQESQYFNLSHEIAHYFIHPSDREYKCNIYQSRFNPLEYQANEFAAEIMCPLSLILECIKKNNFTFNSKNDLIKLQQLIKEKTFLSSKCIQYRIENSKYEIVQFLEGHKRGDIEIISLARQRKKNIFPLFPFEK